MQNITKCSALLPISLRDVVFILQFATAAKNQPLKIETVTMLFMHLIAKTSHAIICPTLSFYRVFLLVRVGLIFC
jgi:hypothetical protein